MLINGYKLQQAIREAITERDIQAARFEPSLTFFPGDHRNDANEPLEIGRRFQQTERRLCSLQTAQARYNLAVTVVVAGESISLCEAIKLVGGAGRFEKMLRSAITEKKERYSYRDETRQEGTIVAQKALTFEQADTARKTAHRWAAALRTAIASGNATELELGDISDESLSL